ncbi:MAG: protein-L-isoaspartate(D-aspartate) O-methyltransferase [Dehalococcoidia bacterium]|nr:protein-L-isoaspartate(D-aspartate) O-methyltransferase [Dehalococcoidia bacterium]
MDHLETTKADLIGNLNLEITDKRVIEAIKHVPREAFVPKESCYAAYEDRPLSIGFGQTISQPFIVALMVQALNLKGNEKVLELGTGSGYESAILAELARQVITIERVPELAASAKQVLQKLGYFNIKVHIARNYLGWLKNAPYDAIIVSAGAPSIPDILLEQLTWGGRLIIPTGSRWQQELTKVTKLKTGNKVENLGVCYFVPLIGKGAWEK